MMPPRVRSNFSPIKLLMELPTRTANPLDKIRAREADKNINNLLVFLLEAKVMVANWVLSPSSAIKILKKTDKNILKSMDLSFNYFFIT